MYLIAYGRKKSDVAHYLEKLLVRVGEEVKSIRVDSNDGKEEDYLEVTEYGEGKCHTYSEKEVIPMLVKKLVEKLSIDNTLSGRLPN